MYETYENILFEQQSHACGIENDIHNMVNFILILEFINVFVKFNGTNICFMKAISFSD